jgi:thioredoxin 2
VVNAPKVVDCPACGQHNRVPAAASGTLRCGRCREPLPWLVEAGDDDFVEVVERSRLPVLVDLWAEWCAPCRMVAPGVERAARELAGRLKVVKVDVDHAPRTAARLDARSIPTLLVLRDGQVVARQVGALPANRLVAWAESVAGQGSGTGS